jgi:uncharacterized LabA/DUF88 family protein
LVPVAGQPQRYATVIKTEEKGSDVNLATHLLHDADRNRFEAAVVVSSDSDLAEPMRIVRKELRKMVVVLNPYPETPSLGLRKIAVSLSPSAPRI